MKKKKKIQNKIWLKKNKKKVRVYKTKSLKKNTFKSKKNKVFKKKIVIQKKNYQKTKTKTKTKRKIKINIKIKKQESKKPKLRLKKLIKKNTTKAKKKLKIKNKRKQVLKKTKIKKNFYQKKIIPLFEKVRLSFLDIFGFKSFALKKYSKIKQFLEKRRILKEKLKKQLAIKIAKEKKKQQILEKKLFKKQLIIERKQRLKEKKELQKIRLKEKREKDRIRIKEKKEKEKIRLAALRQKEKDFKIQQRQKLLEEKIALRNKIKAEKIAERERKVKLKNYKTVEKDKIKLLRNSLQSIVTRLGFIKDKYQLIKDKRKEEKLKEQESRRLAKIEAKRIFEAEKAEEALKQKVVDRLERYSRNMKSIVFQINKRYLTMRRAPLRFVDRIAENGECFIKNDDAVNEEEYLILLFIDGDNAKQRLRRKISLEDKTDPAETKLFRPKNVFEASDYMIDRLARMFEKERQLKKAS